MSLYRDDILDHWQHPQNFGILPGATHERFAENANCGDRQTMSVKVKNGIIDDVRFSGTGCVISMAASSLLTEYLKGKSVSQVQDLSDETMTELLVSVIAPGRMKCATLGLRAFQEAVADENQKFKASSSK